MRVRRSRTWRYGWFFQQVGLILLGVVLYFGSRGLTENRPAVARDHAHDVLALEARLDLDVEKRLQELLDGRSWLADLMNWIYIWGHWPVIAAVMLWTALRHRVVFLRLRNAMLVSGAAGLVVFISFPVAPPRLAGLGLVDTVTERSHAYRVLQPPAFVNQYAAMPSLHVGWDLLVGLAVVAAARPLLVKALGMVMPVLMAVAVVLTGNHYVLDVVAGVSLALAGQFAALRWEHRQLSRAGPEPPPREVFPSRQHAAQRER
jgi:membrane-associated phospholipid phosphatase